MHSCVSMLSPPEIMNSCRDICMGLSVQTSHASSDAGQTVVGPLDELRKERDPGSGEMGEGIMARLDSESTLSALTAGREVARLGHWCQQGLQTRSTLQDPLPC